MLVYAGIDEAGYGPMLGPLCVGLAVFSVREWSPGDPAPDLWERLAPSLARTPKEATKSNAIPIADSKKLKLSNQSKTRHPLTHLERGVLTMLGTASDEPGMPATDAELFETLGAQLGHAPWYQSEPCGLPVGSDAGTMRIDAAQLRASMQRAGVALLGFHVLVIDESRFNGLLEEHRSKAAVVERALEDQLRRARALVPEGGTLRVVADRQGARTRYGGVLGRVFDRVEPEEESSRASRYKVDHDHGVILHSEAEDAHLPVALASMGAKLVRELAMARFNRHWAARVPELKPTAGYVQDARRWLRDTEGQVTAEEHRAMVRKA